jgi:hypothetical protein
MQHILLLHFGDLDTLAGAYLHTAHAPYAFACIERICFAVRPESIDLHRTDVHTFSAAGAALKIYIDQIHSRLQSVKLDFLAFPLP